MRVLVAGATGVIGRRLVPLLEAVGHDVVAGSRATGLDALDRDSTARFVREAAPDAVVNLLTAIPHTINPRRFAKEIALTDRLRTEGTRNLIEAAPRARHLGQSLAYAYEPGEGPADEDTPLWPDPPAQFRAARAGLAELERRLAEAGGLVLRLGHLTGPGTAYDTGGSTTRAVLAGTMPIIGEGRSVFSFTSTHDAATAIVAALDRDVSGALNVVDDTPLMVREWLPALAARLGAPKPKHLPVALARLVAGGWGVAFMTRLRGADNTRARLWLNWRPRYASFLRETA
ncbi:NAD-dependent epimerase/dehydratase family protein [Nonomuraea typhae]|uniref:NAD-dependent epimerase/dehydratase family protein n=1 Tax=Nonomuraea typhae TaxID=2603600 RepID=UPI0012FB0408|nr:NAD(P)-dependent oxidoreductase [Nonomuraea typhae]